MGPEREGKAMEPFDWDIGQKSGRWTREAVLRRRCPGRAMRDGAAGRGRSEDDQRTVLAGLLETLGLEQAVRLGQLEDWKAAIAALEQQCDAPGNPARPR
jgi:hypothetical protein